MDRVVTKIFVSSDDGELKLAQKLPTRTRQVACASYHAWFLLENGDCKAEHPSGRSFLSVQNERVKQVACAGSTAVLLLEKGTVKWCRIISEDAPTQRLSELPAQVVAAQNIGKIKEVACTDAYVVLLTERGAVYQFSSVVTRRAPKPILAIPAGVTQLAGSVCLCAALTSSNDIYTWQPGAGVPKPEKVECLDPKLRIKSIACGSYHMAAVTQDGQLYTWGTTMHQLGPEKDQLVPRRVMALDGRAVASVSCGATHTACVTEMGRLYTWGIGEDGALCHDDVEDQPVPHLVQALDGMTVVQVACGWHHTIVAVSVGADPNKSRLAKDISSLILDSDEKNEHFSDVTLVGKEDTREFRCHKIVLNRLPVLRRLIEENGAEGGHLRLKLDDVADHLLAYVVPWLYGQQLSAELSVSVLVELATVAKRLESKQLRQACEATLGMGLNGMNVCQRLKELASYDIDEGERQQQQQLRLPSADLKGFYERCFTMIAHNLDLFEDDPSELQSLAALARKYSPQVASLLKGGNEDDADDREQPKSEVATAATDQEDKEEDLSDNLIKFVDNERYSDVKLVVEGHPEIHAHKAILCARSAHFRSMFTLGMREATTNVIEIAGMSQEILMAILRYLYAAKLDLHEETVVELLMAAHQYDILSLQERCEAFIEQGLTMENAGYFLAMAQRFEIQHLQILVWNYMIQNRAEFASEEGKQSLAAHLAPEQIKEFRQKIACVDKCVVKGLHPNHAALWLMCRFTIEARNEEDRVPTCGGERFDVKLYPVKLEWPTSEDASLLNPTTPLFDKKLAASLNTHGYLNGRVAEQKDKDGHSTGTYEVTYTVPARGTYRVEVKLHDQHLRGSPFTVHTHEDLATTGGTTTQAASSAAGASGKGAVAATVSQSKAARKPRLGPDAKVAHAGDGFTLAPPSSTFAPSSSSPVGEPSASSLSTAFSGLSVSFTPTFTPSTSLFPRSATSAGPSSPSAPFVFGAPSSSDAASSSSSSASSSSSSSSSTTGASGFTFSFGQ